jgi:hypothetical protein
VIPGFKEADTEDAACSDELIVVSREAIAIALVKLADIMNFRVTVVDPLLEIADFAFRGETAEYA